MFIVLLACVKNTDFKAGENLYDKHEWLTTISQVSLIIVLIIWIVIGVGSAVLNAVGVGYVLWNNLLNVSRTFASGVILIASISLPFNGNYVSLIYGAILSIGIFSLIADFKQIKVEQGKNEDEEN